MVYLKRSKKWGGDTMYEVTILNLENGKKFTKTFDSLYFLKQFERKCKKSKNIKIIAISKY